jgi:hypothetical protein
MDSAPNYYPRYDLTATLLRTGMVLVAGGHDHVDLRYFPSELYNPLTKKFTVTGFTDSGNFPIKNGLPWKSFDDVFVTKINPAGTTLVFSTCIGGLSSEWGNGIALDGSNSIYVAGYTGSTGFPLKNPIYPLYGGGNTDAFVLKLRTADTGPAVDLLLLSD